MGHFVELANTSLAMTLRFPLLAIDLHLAIAVALVPGSTQVPLSMSNLAATELPRYIAESGDVYDTQTDLTWKRCSSGQAWNNSLGCVGVIRQMTWDVAMNQPQRPWRVPTKEELLTLVEPLHHYPVIDEALFPDMEPLKLWYWSSTTGDSNGSAWYVAFGTGTAREGRRGDFNSVRLVRSGR